MNVFANIFVRNGKQAVLLMDYDSTVGQPFGRVFFKLAPLGLSQIKIEAPGPFPNPYTVNLEEYVWSEIEKACATAGIEA